MLFRKICAAAVFCALFSLPATAQTNPGIETTWTSTQTFAGTNGNTAQSIVSNGTLPATGTSGATFNFNEFNGTNPGYTVTANSIDGFGGFPSTNTVRATYTANGGSTITSAIYGAARETAPSANLTGIIGSAYSNITATGDGLWGMIGFTSIGPTGNVGAAISIAGETIAGTGAVIGSRVGVAAASETNIQGTNLDAAFAVVTGPSPGIAPYSATGPWKYGFVLSRILYGNQGPPLSTNGKVMYADTAFTTQDYSDMSLVTFTGKLFNFSNFAMDANGYTVLGAGSASLPSGDSRLAVTGTSRGLVETYAAQNITTGVDGFQISTSANNNQMFIGAAEANNTTSRFGVTLGNYAEVVSYAASNNGLLIGTVSNKPVIVGVNNTAIMKFETSAGITVPPTVTGGDKGAFTINASGLYVAGNAVLTGNQTITLSGAVTGSGATAITTSLGSFTSSALATALTDETGTGSAVFSASPTFSGTVLMPAHVGGSAAGSTASLNGTSNGVPSNAYVNLQSNGQFVSIGNASPKTYLDLNENLSSSPALAVSSSLMRLQAPDSANGGQEWVSYIGATASAGNILSGATAGGTSASPSGTVAGNYLFNMRGYGYNSGWQIGALMIMQAAEAWSVGHQGTVVDFYTTPVGSTTIAQSLRVASSGGLVVGAAGAAVANGEVAMTKNAASASAPGAGFGKLQVVAGTNAGTCKLIMYAGTSTTATTIIDNVGGGC